MREAAVWPVGTSKTHPGERTAPFLAPQGLGVLLLAPLLVTLIVADIGPHVDPRRAASCLLATWLATAVAGPVLHFGADAIGRVLLARGARPLVATVIAALGGLGGLVFALVASLPRIARIAGGTQAVDGLLLLRALAIGIRNFAAARAWAWHSARNADLARRAAQQEAVALRARLEALQSRTHPHFLFNTLNTIASLVAVDGARAEAMIERLAGVLQYALEAGRRETVPLRDELEAITDYLAIEQQRFGARLRTRIDVDPALRDVAIPPMLLQPLVENAVLHGLGSRPEGGEVLVSARADGDATVLCVEDDGVGPGGSRRKGTGTGVAGVRERLALAFGERASLAMDARAGGGLSCLVRIPARLGA